MTTKEIKPATMTALETLIRYHNRFVSDAFVMPLDSQNSRELFDKCWTLFRNEQFESEGIQYSHSITCEHLYGLIAEPEDLKLLSGVLAEGIVKFVFRATPYVPGERSK